MNVAIVAAFRPEQWTSHSGYISAFQTLNHEVHIFPVVDEKGEPNYNSLDTLHQKKDQMDLILVFGHGQINDPRLKHTGFKCPVFAEMGDDPQQFVNNIKCAELYDVLLTPHLISMAKYKEAGWPHAYWWTHCFDQDAFKVEEATPHCDVVTGMNEYGRRVKLLKLLNEQAGFSFTNKVSTKITDYVAHLRDGRIVFNCSNYGEVTRRIFEAMALGKFVLTDHISERTGLYQMFAKGVHFDVYHNEQELLEKIRYYLDHEEEREQIAAAGCEAVQDHSAYERVEQLLEIYQQLTKG